MRWAGVVALLLGVGDPRWRPGRDDPADHLDQWHLDHEHGGDDHGWDYVERRCGRASGRGPALVGRPARRARRRHLGRDRGRQPAMGVHRAGTTATVWSFDGQAWGRERRSPLTLPATNLNGRIVTTDLTGDGHGDAHPAARQRVLRHGPVERRRRLAGRPLHLRTVTSSTSSTTSRCRAVISSPTRSSAIRAAPAAPRTRSPGSTTWPAPRSSSTTASRSRPPRRPPRRCRPCRPRHLHPPLRCRRPSTPRRPSTTSARPSAPPTRLAWSRPVARAGAWSSTRRNRSSSHGVGPSGSCKRSSPSRARSRCAPRRRT